MATASSTKDQGDLIISDRILQAQKSIWTAEILSAILLWAICLTASLILWAAVDQWIYSAGPIVRSIAWLAFLGLSVAWVYFRILPLLRYSIHPEYAAQRLENQVPSLSHSLLSYLTLRSDREIPGLRGVVVRSVASHAARRLSAPDSESIGFGQQTKRLGIVFLSMIVCLVLYTVVSPKNTGQSIQRLMMPIANIEAPTRVRIESVTPGNAQVVEGTSLQIEATIHGLDEEQSALIEYASDSGMLRTEMKPGEEQDTFSAVIGSSNDGIRHATQYFVTAGDARSGPYDITVQAVPVVTVESVLHEPAAYTRQKPFTTRRGTLTGLEGTKVTLNVKSNRPVRRGKLEFNPSEVGGRWRGTGAKALTIAADQRSLSISWILRRPGDALGVKAIESYRIIVEDENGNQNPDPVIYKVTVSPDLAPEVSIITPQKSPKELPIGMEQLIEINALDPDFGLSRLELEVRKGKQLVGTRPIYDRDKPLIGQQVSISAFRAEDWNLIAGDKVTVRCRAYDNRDIPGNEGPDPNTALSDQIELRIVRVAEEDPEGDDDGLKKKSENAGGDSEQQGENAKGGQEGGAGGEGSPSGDASESEEGTGGSGSSSSEPSDKNSDSQSEGGESQEQTPQDEQAQSDSSDGSGGSSDGSSGKQGTNNPSEENNPDTGSDNPPNENDSDSPEGGAEPGNPSGSESTNPQDSGSESTKPAGDSEGNNATESSDSDANDNASDGSGTPSGNQQSSASDDAQGNEDSENGQASEDDGNLHDGEIMDRIREHMENNKKPGGEQQPKANQDGDGAEGDSSEGDQSDKPQGGDENSGDGMKNESSDGTGGEPGQQPKSGSEGSPKPETDGGQGDPKNSDTENEGGSDSDNDKKQGEGTDSGSESNSKDSQDPNGSNPKPSGGEDSADSTASKDNKGEGEAAENEQGPEGGKPSSAKDDSTAENQSSDGDSDPDGDQSRDGDGTSKDASKGSQDGPKSSEAQPNDENGNPNTPADSKDGSSQANKSSDSQPDAKPSNTSQDGDRSQGADDASEAPSNAQQQSNGTDSGAGTGDGQGIEPEEANAEYADKATDLVLDYLKDKKDAPDPKLLDKLNWTKDDYERFINRWERAKELGRTGNAKQKQEFQEQLESLGIRPVKKAGVRDSTSRQDDLKGLRESGSRLAPPPLYRDAFDAFKRSFSNPQPQP